MHKLEEEEKITLEQARKFLNTCLEEKLFPILDYIPIFGNLPSEENRRFYIQEDDKDARFYLGLVFGEERDRENEVLNKLWNEQAEDTPTNTIRDIDDVEFCDRSTMKFYALPIETVSLASDEAVKIVKKLDIKEKNNIFKDVVKAIRVLHE